MTLTVGSLFSGIGGIDLGLQMAGGFETRWLVEIDPWCRKVLAKHWPGVPCYEDIHDVRGCDVEAVDVLAGGFPCQPVSLAGKGLAQADDRWLWPEVARLVGELRPRWVLLENVPGLLGRGFGDVLGDLAACGYDAEWQCISANAVGAPHIRDRVWIVAYPAVVGRGAWWQGRPDSGSARQHERSLPVMADADAGGWDGRAGALRASWRDQPQNDGIAVADAARVFRSAVIGNESDGLLRTDGAGGTHWWSVEPAVGRVAHGVSGRVDRLRGLGNAVVPQVVAHVGRLILEAEAMR